MIKSESDIYPTKKFNCAECSHAEPICTQIFGGSINENGQETFYYTTRLNIIGFRRACLVMTFKDRLIRFIDKQTGERPIPLFIEKKHADCINPVRFTSRP